MHLRSSPRALATMQPTKVVSYEEANKSKLAKANGAPGGSRRVWHPEKAHLTSSESCGSGSKTRELAHRVLPPWTSAGSTRTSSTGEHSSSGMIAFESPSPRSTRMGKEMLQAHLHLRCHCLKRTCEECTTSQSSTCMSMPQAKEQHECFARRRCSRSSGSSRRIGIGFTCRFWKLFSSISDFTDYKYPISE